MRHKVCVSLGKRSSALAALQRAGATAASSRWQVRPTERSRRSAGVSPGKHLDAPWPRKAMRKRSSSSGSPPEPVELQSFYGERLLRLHGHQGFEGRRLSEGVSLGKHLDARRWPTAVHTRSNLLGSPPAPVRFQSIYDERRLHCHGHLGFEGQRPTGSVSPGKHLLTSARFSPPTRETAAPQARHTWSPPSSTRDREGSPGAQR